MQIHQWEHFVLAQRCCEGAVANCMGMLVPDADAKKQERDRLQTIGFLERALAHLKEAEPKTKK
jgi:hypothetical protein